MSAVEVGFGMATAQAVACALQVIATTNIGVEDLFTDAVESLIVPIRNPEAIRKKMLHLYNPTSMRADGLGGVEASTGFDGVGYLCCERGEGVRECLAQRQGTARQQWSKIIVEQCG